MSNSNGVTKLTITDREFVFEQKYRPQYLDEIVLPESLRTKFESYLSEGSLPNMCLYSPSPGTGKTTTALALAREIGSKKPLLINASLDTSIDTIRTQVYQYATGSSLHGGRKVVILDEVERLSANAQESLKGLLEQVSKNCTFILTTNAATSVNAPLMSRCRLIKYMWSDAEAKQMTVDMLRRACAILDNEGIKYEAKVMAALVKQHFPDNRKLLGTMQDFANEHGCINEGVLADIKSGDLKTLVESMKSRKFNEVKQWCVDNASRLGGDFYPRLTRLIIGNTPDNSLVHGEGELEAIEILGSEQKDHGKADIWLHVLRTLTVLMLALDGKWK